MTDPAVMAYVRRRREGLSLLARARLGFGGEYLKGGHAEAVLGEMMSIAEAELYHEIDVSC